MADRGAVPARAGAAASGQPTLVVGVFEDQVRAEQAVRALEVWCRARGGVGVGPIGVVARRVSGGVSWRARGVMWPRRGGLFGLVAGALLFGLPAAGAAALAGWVVGSLALGVGGLAGAISPDRVGLLVIELVVGVAMLAGLMAGAVGALLGGLVGLIVGYVDLRVRGLRRGEVAMAAGGVPPGAWAAVARARPSTELAVRQELARLGGAPDLSPPALSVVERA